MKIERLRSVTGSFQGKHVSVIGDLMLDAFIWGKAVRISQEAPVPVVEVQRESFAPGGASNVMRNISALGGRVSAYGVTGLDSCGEKLISVLEDNAVDCRSIIQLAERKTTEKQRIIAGNQQLLRIDYEKRDPVPESARERILASVCETIRRKKTDAVIIEDYAKGLLDSGMVSRILEVSTENGIPVGLDPHPSHFIDAKGFTLVTPNRSEAFALSGTYPRDPVHPVEQDKTLLRVAEKLAELWDPKYLLVTLGADGMALFTERHSCKVIPTVAKEVFDVTGAGDTVIASFMLSLLGGGEPEEAAAIANHAAGIVVGKIGTATVTVPELVGSFLN